MFGVVGVSVAVWWRSFSPCLLALIVWWALGMLYWLHTGASAPPAASFAADVLAAIAIWRLSWSTWDRVAVLAFLPTWFGYLAFDGLLLWWTAWTLGLSQFVLCCISAWPWTVHRHVQERTRERLGFFDDVFRRLWGWAWHR